MNKILACLSLAICVISAPAGFISCYWSSGTVAGITTDYLFLEDPELQENPVITPEEAAEHYGEDVIVEGVIINSYDYGRACFLDFESSFTAVIFSTEYAKFPLYPDDYYYGEKVRVSGTVNEYKGKPEIILKSSAQIEFVENPERKRANRVISWEDADKYNNRIVTVEGEIIIADNTGKACYLGFHRNWKRYLSITIFEPHFYKFHKYLEKFYINKKVRVTGLVRKYRRRPEIIVKSPAQIEIVR